ncbi:MAG: thioredoxin-disulfide reductase [Actinobacteria bacterium]|nr:thioredoxin-disulfide reductase [Actinomycetota bacterium]
MENYDITIIGGGPAGLTSAIYATRSLRKVALVEKGVPGGQIATTDLIENYPGFPEGISGPELMQRFEEQAKKFGTDFLNLFNVSEISLEDNMKIVRSTDGRSIISKAVIIATGQNPRKLGVPGESEFTGRGVSYCATCDGAFFKGKKVAVVGGGNSAIQEALYLTRFADSVTVIHRRDQLRADRILQERAFKNEKIQFLWNSVVSEIRGDQLLRSIVVKNVQTGEQKEVELHGVFIYIGYEPNTDFLKGFLELDENGYIITDEKLQTSIPGVFACGDVRKNALKQVSVAVGEGAVAAMSAEQYLDELENKNI